MGIFLDNAATTRVYAVAMDKINNLCLECYGNPSSLHKMGLMAEREINLTKDIISNFLNVKNEEILFTSGATEANNIVIFGISEAYKRDGKHIITTKSEHPSVLESYIELEKRGFEVDFLKLNENGEINLFDLETLIRNDTILVSIMHVNNETGVINPIEEIGKIIKNANINTNFHVDGVQGFCKIRLNVKNSFIDAYSFSGHKLHGPKGIGGFYLKKNIKIKPLFFGGHQQNRIRPGTENIIGIGALGESLKILIPSIDENFQKVSLLKNKLIDGCLVLPNVILNGKTDGSPYILNLSFLGLNGETLVHALEENDIFISTGSACNSKSKGAMLYSYGLSQERVSSAVRFSFSENNTCEEIEKCLVSLEKNVHLLRKYSRR